MLFQYHCIDEFFTAHGSRKLMFFYQGMSVSCLTVFLMHQFDESLMYQFVKNKWYAFAIFYTNVHKLQRAYKHTVTQTNQRQQKLFTTSRSPPFCWTTLQTSSTFTSSVITEFLRFGALLLDICPQFFLSPLPLAVISWLSWPGQGWFWTSSCLVILTKRLVLHFFSIVNALTVEFYLYPTVGTVLIHSIKPELTE